MEIKIQPSTVEKLGHSIEEIRLRALHDIRGKITRASLSGVEIKYNVPDLVRALIQWFRFKPVKCADEVLNLIFIILEDPTTGKEAIGYYGPTRIETEMHKIRKIVNNLSECQPIIDEILEGLEKYKNIIENTKVNRRKTIAAQPDQSGDSLLAVNSRGTKSVNEIIDLTSIEESLNDIIQSDYVKQWSVPEYAEMQVLKELKENLKLSADEKSLLHTLSYLKTTIRDFPPEYFLQPPYIYLSVLKLTCAAEDVAKEVFVVLKMMTIAIKKRAQCRKMAITRAVPTDDDSNAYNQISVGKFGYGTLCTILENVKENKMSNEREFLVATFQLACDIISMMEIDGTALQSHLCTIITDFGYLAKYYRVSFENSGNRESTFRNYQLIVLRLIVRLRKFIKIVADDSIWMNEMKIVSTDLLVKYFYAKLYDDIREAVGPLNDDANIFLASSDLLNSAIVVLRNSDKYRDVELIFEGLKMIQTLSVTKSIDLVGLLMKAIFNKEIYYSRDPNLRTAVEELYVQLLAHNLMDIRKHVYKLSGSRFQTFFNNITEGEERVEIHTDDNGEAIVYIGIPLTPKILSEFICFGYISENVDVHESAERILNLLICGKLVMGKVWKEIWRTMTLVYPLLQCHVSSTSKLGEAIFKLFDLSSDVEDVEILKANIRFLFSEDQTIRSNALTRLLYMLESNPRAHEFMPNISNISDTIPSDICYVRAPCDPARMHCEGDASTIGDLLELLRSSDIQPSVRKSALLQLNVMAGNPHLNQEIYNQNGWIDMINLLELSLISNNTVNIDEVIPITGLFAKFALNHPLFRNDVLEYPFIFLHLIRALFLYHSNIALKQDASVALILFLYHDYIIDTANIQVPFILSKLKVPLLTEFYCRTSANQVQSQYELIYGTNSVSAQNFRLQFAFGWFNDFDGVMENITESSRDQAVTSKINYAGTGLRKPLDFNHDLVLKKSDIHLIKSTSPCYTICGSLKVIDKGIDFAVVFNSIQSLQSLLLLPLDSHLATEYSESIVTVLSKFYSIPPNAPTDIVLFRSVLILLSKFIKAGYQFITLSLLRELKKKKSIFEIILQSNTTSSDLYIDTVKFMKVLLMAALSSRKKEIVMIVRGERSVKERSAGIIEDMFERVSTYIERISINKPEEFGKLLALLVLYRQITTNLTFDYDIQYTTKIINLLMEYITLTKSFSQTGSNFNKNCLFCVGNLMHDNEIKPKYFKLLSSLCSHGDFEIRALAWNLMSKTAKNIDGAETIILELMYLPGGIHACALSTIFDKHEVSMVRSAAAVCFANLICHPNRTKGGLHKRVTPRCKSMSLEADTKPYEVLEEVLELHQFFQLMRDSFKFFTVADTIETDNKEIVTCDLICGYCMILVNLIDLNPNRLQDANTLTAIYELFCLLVYMPVEPTKSSLQLASEISNLLSMCFSKSEYPELLERISVHDYSIMGGLGALLNIKYFDNISSFRQSSCLINIMDAVRLIINTPSGFKHYSRLWNENNCIPLLDLLIACIHPKHPKRLLIASMSLLHAILLMAQSAEHDFQTLFDSFENTSMKKPEIETEIICLDLENDENHNPNGRTKVTKKKSKKNKFEFGTEILAAKLTAVYNDFSSKDKPENGVVVMQLEKRGVYVTMQVLLKCSERARNVARDYQWTERLLDRLEDIHTGLGMPCKEFIRKYGDNKKHAIILELSFIANLLSSWYASENLVNEALIARFCELFILFWPWAKTSRDLEITFLNCLLYMSHNCVPVCRGIVANTIGPSGTLLKYIVSTVTDASTKEKNPKLATDVIEIGLHVLGNCCICIEGRLQLNKMNVLDIFQRMQPYIAKNIKGWISVTFYWLQFWKTYSKHLEGGALRHLNLLCLLILKSNPEIRILALEIIRNMCFLVGNRSGILTSESILQMFRDVLGTENWEVEHAIVVQSVWKLIANNAKGKATIKSTAIPLALNNILKRMLTRNVEDCEESDLYNMVVIVNGILSDKY